MSEAMSGLEMQLETRRLGTKNTGNENKTRPRIGGWQKRSMCRKVLSNWWGCNNTKVSELYKRGQIQNWSVKNLNQRLLIEGWKEFGWGKKGELESAERQNAGVRKRKRGGAVWKCRKAKCQEVENWQVICKQLCLHCSVLPALCLDVFCSYREVQEQVY